MQLSKETEKEIRQIYQAYWDAYLQGDFETFASFLDDDVVIYGTATGEIFYTKEEALNFYIATAQEMTGKAEFRNRDILIQPVGNAIAIYEQSHLYILIEGAWTFYGDVRITGIFEHRENGWKLVHQHGSFPDSRTEAGQQIASEKIKEENLQLREAVRRRTVELENTTHELSIEASLERVRSATMSMHKPDDMLKVCQVISDQLQILNVKDIRNVQTAIIDEHGKGSYLNYQYFTQYAEGIVEEVVIAKHPAVMDLIQHLQRSPDTFFNHSFEGEELEKWKQYRMNENQLPDPILESASAVHFYFYSIGEGGLGLSAYTPLTDDKIEVFNRFRNVFALAYQRFRDIEQAEAHAREARIEASLERVRSVALGMRKAPDLLDICEVLYTELEKLEFIGLRNAMINILDDNTETFLNYDYSPLVGRSVTLVKYDAQAFIENQVQKLKASNDAFIEDIIDGPLLKELIDLRISQGETDDPRLHSIDVLTYYFYSIGVGAIGISSFNSLTEEQRILLRRFRNVFEFAYRRYMDIAKAEAQAREAKIEAGLERIRSRTMAMQACDELAETALVALQELIKLGIAPNRLYIAIIENDSTDVHFYLTNEDGGQDCSVYTAQIDKSPTVRTMYNAWAAHQSSMTLVMEGDELASYLNYLREEVGVPYKNANIPQRRVQTIAYFSQGYIGIVSNDEQPEETTQLLERFAAVFNLTYTRFNDLKQAEKLAYQANLDLLRLKEEKLRTELAMTELKATQAQLIQAEKMASLGELTAGIAHEIQNPLNFVNNFSEVNTELIEEMKLELQTGNTAEAIAIANDIADNEQKINHHGKRADAIVKGMLQHSRTSSGHTEPTDINALAAEYLRLAYHGLRAKDKSFNATMQTEFDDSIGLIDVIPQDIGRVILNLITNAFYAVSTLAPKSPKGDLPYTPIVTVNTKLIKSPSGDLGANKVTISVTDNGSGIPSHILDKIFQPFFTTKPTGKGTGLGLSLSYDIVKAHGGELKVETKEGEGSVFTIILPL